MSPNIAEGIMYSDLITLRCDVMAVASVLEQLEDAIGSTALSESVRGVWTIENGVIGTIVLVRVFHDLDQMMADHTAQYLSASPFAIQSGLNEFSFRSYQTFDFADVLEPGHYGGIYEIRTYHLKLASLQQTLAGWKRALPSRLPVSPLAIGMHAIDGPPTITHIWPFKDSNSRIAVREKLYSDGLWPPHGGPESILHGTSTIALPARYSGWR